jgi:hypothetical protein
MLLLAIAVHENVTRGMGGYFRLGLYIVNNTWQVNELVEAHNSN